VYPSTARNTPPDVRIPSDAASFVAGAAWSVDGGLVAVVI
jgi:hypothetical protein